MAGGKPIGVPLRLVSTAELRLPSPLLALRLQSLSSCFQRDGAGPEPTSADLELDFDELESRFSAKTKILVLNNPHNPSGKVGTGPVLGSGSKELNCSCSQRQSWSVSRRWQRSTT